MTIISILVCNNQAKLILARQFVEITRKELEEHTVVFNRLLHNDKDSTIIESEKNRYLYIHCESDYIVLVTSKDSNVIEDMEILKLAYRLISDVCSGKISDSEIISNAFEIVLGLDDIVSLGMFDGVNLMQIKQFLEMDSAEEKEYRKQQLEREKAAAEHLRVSMQAIEKDRKNKPYLDAIGSDTITIGGSLSSSNSLDQSREESSKSTEKENITSTSQAPSKKAPKTKGLALGKKKDYQQVEKSETKVEDGSESKKGGNNIKQDNVSDIANDTEVKFNPLSEPVRLEIIEKLKGEINKDGEFKKLEVKGEGFLTLLNPNKKNFYIGLKTELKPKFNTSKIDKKLFNDKGVIICEVSS
jgi:coatomer subunit delta